MHFRKCTSTSTCLLLLLTAATCNVASSLEQADDTARVRSLHDIALVRSPIRDIPA
jgi:hypothetical protein